ncbi:MAG: 2-phosphosulfolactate phosphatase [Deinococcota bacterium]
MNYDQHPFDIRCEWGAQGVARLAPVSDAIIIVDVLSFSTAVTVAVSRGARVYPYKFRDGRQHAYARECDARLAGPRSTNSVSLSPVSLLDLKAGERIVLPSPNGATLSLATGHTPTFAGCLRNAHVVARAAMVCGPRVSVIAAGERWQEGNSLRIAYEDMLGAGAILRHLPGQRSPEASAAIAVFEQAATNLKKMLHTCNSGQELIQRGFSQDVDIAAQLEADDVAPRLMDGAYTNASKV